MKNQKKVLAVSLCLGIIVSCFSPLTIGFAQEAKQQISDKIHGKLKAPDTAEKAPDKLQLQADPQLKAQAALNIDTAPKTEQVKISRSKKRDPKSDKYKLSQEEVEKLIQDGHSIQDILIADELGNTHDVNPKTLLKDKKDKKKDWKNIENELSLVEKEKPSK